VALLSSRLALLSLLALLARLALLRLPRRRILMGGIHRH